VRASFPGNDFLCPRDVPGHLSANLSGIAHDCATVDFSGEACEESLRNDSSLRRRSGEELGSLLLFHFLHFLFHVLDLDAVLADIETQVRVDAHVLIGDPDQSEKRDQVAAPVIE
jgi:hypothetical protein